MEWFGWKISRTLFIPPPPTHSLCAVNALNEPEWENLSDFGRGQSPSERSRVGTPVVHDLADSLQIQDRRHLCETGEPVTDRPRRHGGQVADEWAEILVKLQATQL